LLLQHEAAEHAHVAGDKEGPLNVRGTPGHRQSDLLVRAAEVFGDQGPTWMTKPHPLLDGKTPIEFAANEYGGEKVRAILTAIEHGGVV
jgi:uncharacterized protein (DUF2384 family)